MAATHVPEAPTSGNSAIPAPITPSTEPDPKPAAASNVSKPKSSHRPLFQYNIIPASNTGEVAIFMQSARTGGASIEESAIRITCDIFAFLKAAGLPVAFEGVAKLLSKQPRKGAPTKSDTQSKEDELPTYYFGFTAPRCKMLPYMVFTHRVAGDYPSTALRNKGIGDTHKKLAVDLHLKSTETATGPTWKGRNLLCENPLMWFLPDDDAFDLYNPELSGLNTADGLQPSHTYKRKDVFAEPFEEKYIVQMEELARRAFLILEKAFKDKGLRLHTIKLEFGIDPKGNLSIADIVDLTSWCIVDSTRTLLTEVIPKADSNQRKAMAANFEAIAKVVATFTVPTQQILIWAPEGPYHCLANTVMHTLSIHFGCIIAHVVAPPHTASPVEMQAMPRPDFAEHILGADQTVIITDVPAYNQELATISWQHEVPVICCLGDTFAADAHNSLKLFDAYQPEGRRPQVTWAPYLESAVRAALAIFALSNPYVYAALRYELEPGLPE